jgi:outer membrane protein OmpA-like peptidoglycan-associated protein
LEARIEGKRVELQGLVSTPSAERALLAHLRRHVWRAQVAETLDVANGKPDADWLRVARTGLAQLAHLDVGFLRLDGRAVSMSGRPKRERDRDAILAAMNDLPAGFTSSVMLERTVEPAPAPSLTPSRPTPAHAVAAAVPEPPAVSRRTAKPRRAHAAPRRRAPRYRIARYEQPALRASLSLDCRRRFGDVLPRVAAEFESGSARLRASAGLDEFARIALSCPGVRIRLIGHSDTHEAPVHSQRLSRERALAVREALEHRGVAGSKISIAGRGGTRPAFSNATADGRGNNRRVEFAVW